MQGEIISPLTYDLPHLLLKEASSRIVCVGGRIFSKSHHPLHFLTWPFLRVGNYAPHCSYISILGSKEGTLRERGICLFQTKLGEDL